MKKRIFAWILLTGFFLLLLNILVFRFYWQLSAAAYVIIVVAFILTNGRLVRTQDNGGYDPYGERNGGEGNTAETGEAHKGTDDKGGAGTADDKDER